jgi:hypothetical protein
MYKLSFVFLFFGFSLSLSAQSSQYAVEVGAYAEKVPLSYFKKLNQKVYETLDVNEIYRYYVDVADENRGQIVRAEAKAAGHKYARIIDFESQRQLCANQCGYTPPTPTDPANRLTPPRPTKRGQTTPETSNNEIQIIDGQGNIINITADPQTPNSPKIAQNNSSTNNNNNPKTAQNNSSTNNNNNPKTAQNNSSTNNNNNPKTAQNNSSTNNNNNPKTAQNNSQTDPKIAQNNNQLNPTPAPTPKPKRKKIINNHYDK